MKTLEQAIADVKKRDRRNYFLYGILGLIIVVFIGCTIYLSVRLEKSNEDLSESSKRIEKIKDSLLILDKNIEVVIGEIERSYDSISEIELTNTKLARYLDSISQSLTQIATLRALSIDSIKKIDNWKIKAREIGLDFTDDKSYEVIVYFNQPNADLELKVLNLLEIDTTVQAFPRYDTRNYAVPNRLFYYDSTLEKQADKLAKSLNEVFNVEIIRGEDQNINATHSKKRMELFIEQ